MNFIFISPHFPESYWLFCQGLKKHGVNVLAICDTPYEALSNNVKNSICDFYRVNHLDDYDEMLRAVAFLTYKHGKIDWIESNNEFWLRQDAKLRQDFHVTNGMAYERMDDFQSKSKMKEFYQKAGLPYARYGIADTLEHALAFVKEVHYPIVIKPDVGVGSSSTYKINNEEALRAYFADPAKEKMIMEEYIKGDTFSFDGITNSKKELLFVTSHCYVDSLMDCVNEQKTVGCYSRIDIPEDVMDAGKRVVQAFDTRSRFFHFEFFRLTEDQLPVGKKGDLVALEVNMRPPGGFLPDMIDYAHDCNVYQLWADMIVEDTIHYKQVRKYSCGFIGRRKNIDYEYSVEDIQKAYGEQIKMVRYLPPALAQAMGEETIVARFPSEKEMLDFFRFAGTQKKSD